LKCNDLKCNDFPIHAFLFILCIAPLGIFNEGVPWNSRFSSTYHVYLWRNRIDKYFFTTGLDSKRLNKSLGLKITQITNPWNCCWRLWHINNMPSYEDFQLRAYRSEVFGFEYASLSKWNFQYFPFLLNWQFHGFVICVIFRPRDLQEYYMLFGIFARDTSLYSLSVFYIASADFQYECQHLAISKHINHRYWNTFSVVISNIFGKNGILL
jgi:hypothetical protein